MSCSHTAPLLNIRPWPGENFSIGECSACGSTRSIPNDHPTNVTKPAAESAHTSAVAVR